MPVLQKSATTKIVLPTTEKLPEAEQAWVKVKNNLSLEDIIPTTQGDTELDKAINGVANFISEWNYTNPDGSPIEITADSIKLIDWSDFTFIRDLFYVRVGIMKQGVSSEEKKTSTESSEESTTKAVQL